MCKSWFSPLLWFYVEQLEIEGGKTYLKISLLSLRNNSVAEEKYLVRKRPFPKGKKLRILPRGSSTRLRSALFPVATQLPPREANSCGSREGTQMESTREILCSFSNSGVLRDVLPTASKNSSSSLCDDHTRHHRSLHCLRPPFRHHVMWSDHSRQTQPPKPCARGLRLPNCCTAKAPTTTSFPS